MTALAERPSGQSPRGRHRRPTSLRAEGRHRARYGAARWLVPAGLAVIILVVVAAALLLTDVTTS
jgi:hypothetical protein